MATQWNSRYFNIHFGNQYLRPCIPRQMVFACRICEKIHYSSQALIEHYEAHQKEFNQRTQIQQTAPYVPSLRESRERNLANNHHHPRLAPPSILQQRHHPYFPNGFRMLQNERTSIAQRNPFHAATQTENLSQPRNPVVNHNTLGVPLPSPNSISGRTTAGCSQFFIHQRLSPTQRVLSPQLVPPPNYRGQNCQEELSDNGTAWYLRQLEKPIPKMIDLEGEDDVPEYSFHNIFISSKEMG